MQKIPVVLNVSINVYIPKEQDYVNGGKEKLPESTRGRNVKRNKTQKGTRAHTGSVFYMIKMHLADRSSDKEKVRGQANVRQCPNSIDRTRQETELRK